MPALHRRRARRWAPPSEVSDAVLSLGLAPVQGAASLAWEAGVLPCPASRTPGGRWANARCCAVSSETTPTSGIRHSSILVPVPRNGENTHLLGTWVRTRSRPSAPCRRGRTPPVVAIGPTPTQDVGPGFHRARRASGGTAFWTRAPRGGRASSADSQNRGTPRTAGAAAPRPEKATVARRSGASPRLFS